MYVEASGRFQKKFDEMYEKLVPPQGSCMTLQGEVLRAVVYMYRMYYNDGEFIDRSNAVGNAWGFLHESCQISDDKKLESVRQKCEELIDEIPYTKVFERTLETLFDLCVQYSCTEPVVEINHDFYDERYNDIYKKYMDYTTPFNEKELETVE